MTPEERAWCESVHRQAMAILGACGNLEIDAEPGSKQAKRARRAQQMALALATEASARIRDAGMRADLETPAAYDLAGLAAMPMAGPELGE